MRYFRKIVGDNVYLSPMNIEDAETYTKWLNDKSVSNNLGNYSKMISIDGERKALEDMASKGYNFAMVRNADDVLIGNISLMDADFLNRTATLGIFIGDAENRGKGYGTEAIRLILSYGFNTLNLNNVRLSVHADNENAIACYRKAGFREFGRRRQCKYKDGRYIDTVYMDMLGDEFNARM